MKSSCDVRPVRAVDPEPDIIASAVRIIRTGGVVVFPTTGLYGLGVDALNPVAVGRIFRIKQRPEDKPILLLIRDAADLPGIVEQVTPLAELLMSHFWPGGLTLVFQAKKRLPQALTAGSGKIGVRLPLHPVARALVSGLEGPLTATSANLSGRLGCDDPSLLDDAVAAGVDMILDAGKLSGGPGSTVVDVTGERPLILREGAVGRRQIEEAAA